MRNRSLCSSGISARVSSSSAGPPPGMPWLRLTAPGSARKDGWYSPEWFLRHASAYHFGAYLNCTQTRASAVSLGALVWYSLQSNCVLAQLGREFVIEYQLVGYQDGWMVGSGHSRSARNRRGRQLQRHLGGKSLSVSWTRCCAGARWVAACASGAGPTCRRYTA